MSKTRIAYRIPSLFALLTLVLAAGAAQAEELAVSPQTATPLSAGRPFSPGGFARQFGRGITNIALFWLEIPYQTKAQLVDKENERPTTVFVTLYDFVAGLTKGTVKSVERLVGGVIEVATSPIPTYTPLMEPPYPPFVLMRPAAPVACAPVAPQP